MRLKRFAEKLWGSPCSIVLAFPTPNAAGDTEELCVHNVFGNRRSCERTNKIRRRSASE
jgi:hypothetical protein